jgi:penicillin-binding protein 2
MQNPFGNIFGEEISFSRAKRKNSLKDFEVENERRRSPFVFFIVLFLGMAVLFARLFEVTLIKGKQLRELSIENRIREDKVTAARGIIYDRNGEQLVRNIPLFESKDGNLYFEQFPSSNSSLLRESITRQYMYGELFAHVLGYVGEASEEEIKDQRSELKNSGKELESGDTVGKVGVEKTYDELLRGKDGKQLQEVDAAGTVVRTLGKVDPASGRPLTLSLDLELQKAAAAGLKDKKGAVVVTVPQTGEVLALYSSPSFDPNSFIRMQGTGAILSDSAQPLFNRSISGLYPPGSTFKIVIGLAALETGAISRETQIEDTGILQVGQFSFGNWYYLQYGRKEGIVDIIKALKRSNDIFFYKTGEALGIEKLSQWAKKMGIGISTGIDIPGEMVGIMPDPASRKLRGENWYLGDTYHVSIGQGELLTTPLEVNTWTNVIANKGKLCKPKVVLAKDQRSKIKDQSNCDDLNLKKDNIELIREGMKEACATGGTGWPFFNFSVPEGSVASLSGRLIVDNLDFFDSPAATSSAKKAIGIPVACKTGTAEHGDATTVPHAWFTAFAPVHNPQLSVTVLVEEAGEGSNVAAPIAKKIFETWFSK